MAIERFSGWGTPVEGSVDVEVFADDSALAAAAHKAIETGQRLQASVATGDLLATLGLQSPRSGTERHLYPIDLGLARNVGAGGESANEVDAPWLPFAAHAIAGRVFGPGWFCSVMNAPWLGSWRLGPRAHPNDGKLDITTGTLPLREIPEARRRSQSGSHLPHPALEHQRRGDFSVTFRRPTSVKLDLRRVGTWAGIEVKTIADAFVLVA